MNTIGSISYSASCKGLVFPTIQIENPATSIDRVEIKTEAGDRISITVHIRDIFDIKDATPITLPVVERLLNRIVFEHGCQIEAVLSTGHTLPQVGQSKKRLLSSTVMLYDHVEATITLGSESQQKLKEVLEKPESERDSYLALYRVAISQEDSTSRFLLLYNLLLSICSDRQPAVDVQIKHIKPDVVEGSSPHNNNRSETIYTRLRNEIGHNRDGSRPEKTIKEISAHVASFQDIVKQSIP